MAVSSQLLNWLRLRRSCSSRASSSASAAPRAAAWAGTWAFEGLAAATAAHDRLGSKGERPVVYAARLLAGVAAMVLEVSGVAASTTGGTQTHHHLPMHGRQSAIQALLTDALVVREHLPEGSAGARGSGLGRGGPPGGPQLVQQCRRDAHLELAPAAKRNTFNATRPVQQAAARRKEGARPAHRPDPSIGQMGDGMPEDHRPGL